VSACDVAEVADGDATIDRDTCKVDRPRSGCLRRIAAGGFPFAGNVPGYVSFVILYLFFALFTLFVTAGLNDETANRWLIQSAITTVVTGLVIQPITAIAIAGFGFTNAVLMQALSRLSA